VRVVVCIKQISYVYHPIAINSSGGHIDQEKMVFMLNPYDEIAVEEAIKIKKNLSNCEVIVITVGPRRAEEALRYAFAMGADKMIRINYESSDSWLISLALAKIIKDLSYDLILCGKKTIDNNGNQAGSFIAELLHIPQVSGIVRLEILPEKKKAIVERYLVKGDRQVVECNLPALFTVENGINDPRYPSLPNRLLSEKKNIEVIDLTSLGLIIDQEMDFYFEDGEKSYNFKAIIKMAPDGSFYLTDGKAKLYFGILNSTFYFYHLDGNVNSPLKYFFFSSPKIPLFYQKNIYWKDHLPLITISSKIKRELYLFLSSFKHDLFNIKVESMWESPDIIKSKIHLPKENREALIKISKDWGIEEVIFDKKIKIQRRRRIQ